MPNSYVWRTTLFASFSIALTGYYDGSMNGILEMEGFHHFYADQSDRPALPDGVGNYSVENASDYQACSTEDKAGPNIIIGLTVSISNLGSLVGSLLAGWLSDQFSRKYGVLIGTVVIGFGSILLASSYYMWIFILGRCISGIGVGMIFMVVPIYVSEMSPKDSRGILVSFTGISYSLGVLLAACTNIGFSQFLLGWRVAVIVQACMTLLYALGIFWLPHTPRWLVMKRRNQEALLVLTSINNHSKKETFVDTYVEFEELKTVTNSSDSATILKNLLKRKYITRLCLTITLFLLFAMLGNFIYFYVTTLFCQVGVFPFIAALAVGLLILVASIILPLSIDKVGRKVLLLSSSFMNIILAMLVGTLVLVFASTTVAVTYLVVVLICLYCFSVSTTWLAIPWIINSEVFPPNISGLAVGVSTGSYWFFTFVTNQVIPLILASPLGVYGFFYIIAVINVFAFFFVLFTLPETKGVGLEHMDELFSQSYLKRVGLGCMSYRFSPPISVSDSVSDDKGEKLKVENWNKK